MSGPVIKVRVIRQPVLKARMLSQWPARVAVGSVTTGEPGTSAAVENVGTAGSAVLNFTIPRGNGGIVQSLVAGSNITINATDPAHPIINSTASGSGDVVGPSSAVDGTPTVFDGTSGKLLKNITFSAFKALLSLVKGDVGLGNVDNTSDSTKNAATVTLTNKTLTSPVINGATGSAASSFTATTQAARDNSTKLATTAYVDVATRELLTANRTYYVRTDGNDSNNGLANSSGGAFLTIQKAWDVACGNLDLAGYTVKIKIDDGTYSAGITSDKSPLGGKIEIEGNVATPANVIISRTSGDAFSFSGTSVLASLKGVIVSVASSWGSGVFASGKGVSLSISSISFGATVGPKIWVDAGASVSATGTFAATGNSEAFIRTSGVGSFFICTSATITVTGTPAFSVAFALAYTLSNIKFYTTTISGSATGPRYSASGNSIIDTSGGGSSYFPGGTAGTTSSGGQYL